MTKIKFMFRKPCNNFSYVKAYDKEEIEGYRFEHDGFVFVAFKQGEWKTSEITTGLMICTGRKTRADAIEKTKEIIGVKGHKTTQLAIENALNIIEASEHPAQYNQSQAYINRVGFNIDRYQSEYDKSMDYQLAKMAGYVS